MTQASRRKVWRPERWPQNQRALYTETLRACSEVCSYVAAVLCTCSERYTPQPDMPAQSYAHTQQPAHRGAICVQAQCTSPERYTPRHYVPAHSYAPEQRRRYAPVLGAIRPKLLRSGDAMHLSCGCYTPYRYMPAWSYAPAQQDYTRPGAIACPELWPCIGALYAQVLCTGVSCQSYMLLRSSGAMHRPWAQDAMRPGAMHRCAERYTPQRYVPAQSYAPAQRRFAPWCFAPVLYAPCLSWTLYALTLRACPKLCCRVAAVLCTCPGRFTAYATCPPPPCIVALCARVLCTGVHQRYTPQRYVPAQRCPP